MDIRLIEIDDKKFESFEKYFEKENVKLIHDDLCKWIKQHDANAYVAPSNSYGIMDNGYNSALTFLFGEELGYRVQEHIFEEYRGFQPVGSAFICKIPNSDMYLIHTPTVKNPSGKTSEKNVYQCMKNSLQNGLANNISSVVIPMLGSGENGLDSDISSRIMHEAYVEFMDNSLNPDWVEEIKASEKLKIKKQKLFRR